MANLTSFILLTGHKGPKTPLGSMTGRTPTDFRFSKSTGDVDEGPYVCSIPPRCNTTNPDYHTPDTVNYDLRRSEKSFGYGPRQAGESEIPWFRALLIEVVAFDEL